MSQGALVERLDEFHARGEPGLSTIAPQLIGKWETAYTDKKGRQWTPQRQHVLYLIEAFSDQLTLKEAQIWASQAGYTLGKTELQSIFPLDLDWPPAYVPELPNTYIKRQPLETAILNRVENEGVSALVLWGPGGAGKTIQAVSAAKSLSADFADGVVWIAVQPDDTVTDILDEIARSLGVVSNEDTLAKRARRLHSRLRKKQCLLVLDDLAAAPDLAHLRLGSESSPLLCTTRDAKVAHLLQAERLQVNGLTGTEGLELLSRWAGCRIEAEELVTRLGGLPLALSLSGAQLQAGFSPDTLLTAFQEERVDLSVLDMDDPQSQAESLTLCFDLSYRRLQPESQQRFARLGYFAGRTFQEAAVAALWGVSQQEARITLKQLLRFAFLEQPRAGVYQLHPLLRDYARSKLSQAAVNQSLRRRHAIWHIRYALYHPGLLGSDLGHSSQPHTGQAPNLDQTWADVVAGVKWAAANQPQLAAQAALLAHTERPALLEEVGQPLIEAMEAYLTALPLRQESAENQVEQAVLYEIVGDMCLLRNKVAAGLTHFEQAGRLWQMMEDGFAAGRAKLRTAGAYLLLENYSDAAEAARQAQAILQQCLPVADESLSEARDLFYWFAMVYDALIRWAELPEADVISLSQLASRSEQPLLEARGLHIHSLWCLTNAVARPPEIRQQGRELALQAYVLWRKGGWREQADSEVSFAKYYLSNRFSRRTAIRFARRRSRQTPQVSHSQLRLINSSAIRWWLEATEDQRINWLSWMLPRYMGADNRPRHPSTGCQLPTLQPGSCTYRWVEDILDIGMLGEQGRRLMTGNQRPANHILNGPQWRVLSGQKILPLANKEARTLVERYLQSLETRHI